MSGDSNQNNQSSNDQSTMPTIPLVPNIPFVPLIPAINNHDEDEENVDDEEEDDDDDDDDIQVTIGDVSSVINSNLRIKQRQTAQASKPKAGIDLETTGDYQGKAIIDVNLDQLEDKPWRKPGADICDYFNYGLNEETWKVYCEQQKKMRNVNDNVGEASNNASSQVNAPELVDMSSSQIPIATVNENSKYAAHMQPIKKAGPPPGRRNTGYIDPMSGSKPIESLPLRGIPVIVSQNRTLREMELHAEEMERQRVNLLNMEQRRHDQEMMQHMERQWQWEQEKTRLELQEKWQIEQAEREEQEILERREREDQEVLERREREKERERERFRDKDRDRGSNRHRNRSHEREREKRKRENRSKDRPSTSKHAEKDRKKNRTK